MRASPSIPDEYAELRERLRVAEDTLRGINNGEVDALYIQCEDGPKVYTIYGQEAETNRFHSKILSQIGDIVIAVDSEERITYLNAAAGRKYGVSATDALGRKLSSIYGAEWLLSEDEAAKTAGLHECGEWHGEMIHIKHDGSRMNVEIHLTQLRQLDGRATGQLAVIRDVTRHRRNEKKLRLSEVRYRRLFEAAHDGVIIIDSGTRKIIDANPYMTHMLGYSHDELIGKELFEISLLKDEAASQAMVEDLKRSSCVRYEDLPFEGQDGVHHDVEVVANLYDEDGHSVIQCNVRDITDRKKAEEHVKLLIGEVNHRARNLLAVVLVVARQTAASGDKEPFLARLSDRINGLAAGQDLLVDTDWQGVEIADLVKAQLSHFKELIGARVLIDGPSVRLMPSAAQAIGMALHELATNAAKYGALSNGDGTVRISWLIEPTFKPSFSMSWEEEGGPKVAMPTRTGFGTIVTGRMAGGAINGLAETTYRENGLSWKLTGPAESAIFSEKARRGRHS